MFCRACHSEKLPVDFYDGVKSRCKDCHKAAMKIRRLTNPRVQAYDRIRYRTPERKAQGAANAKQWREAHPEAYKAHNAVNNAIRDRRLEKGPCAICGTLNNVQGHHRNYSKPLDVIWLCAQCHHRVHATFPELGGHYEGAQ
jgi:hypothetical protein